MKNKKNEIDRLEPHILKRFLIQKKLGQGAYGTGFKAIDKKTKELVALKKLFGAFQDDTDRAEAIKVANQKRVFFGAGGACINDVDYPQVKDLPYFVGSAGTTVSNDREATREMTEYYLNCMIERAKGYDELVKYQTAVKGIVIPDEIEEEE